MSKVNLDALVLSSEAKVMLPHLMGDIVKDINEILGKYSQVIYGYRPSSTSPWVEKKIKSPTARFNGQSLYLEFSDDAVPFSIPKKQDTANPTMTYSTVHQSVVITKNNGVKENYVFIPIK